MYLERGIVHVPNTVEGVDKDVPTFGDRDAKLRPPVERPLQKDAFGSDARVRRKDNALGRALQLAYGIGDVYPVPVPIGEDFQHYSFKDIDWDQLGNMETSYARTRKRFRDYRTRWMPASYAPAIRTALGNEDVLSGWHNVQPTVEELAKQEYGQALTVMSRQRTVEAFDKPNGRRGAFQAPPVFYATSQQAGVLEQYLWQRGLSQAAREFARGDYRNVRKLVELHEQVQDPVSPLNTRWDHQAALLEELHREAQQSKPKNTDPTSEQVLTAQLVHEASSLSSPGADQVFYVGFGGHQELAYVPAVINGSMPRGEFASPTRTLAVLREMIADAKQIGVPVTTPITVGYFQEPGKSSAKQFIVDGNNRATAEYFMKYKAEVGNNRVTFFNPLRLHQFVEEHGLDVEWERDLKVAIAAMRSDDFDELSLDQDIIEAYAASDMPALLTHEPDFHTIAVQLSKDSRIVLLQPMHQAIYNQLGYPMAILSKMQSHGRAIYNDRKVIMLPNKQQQNRIIRFPGRQGQKRAA